MPPRRAALPLLLACALLAGGLLAGCDEQRAARLEEGLSTEAEVRQQFGEPAQVTERADGSRLLSYPRQPEGFTNYEAEIGADGRLLALRQLLTEANFAKIRPGMEQAEVARILGRHARELAYATRPDERVWRWHVQRGQDRRVFDVRFDRQGRVLDSQLADDDRVTQPGG